MDIDSLKRTLDRVDRAIAFNAVARKQDWAQNKKDQSVLNELDKINEEMRRMVLKLLGEAKDAT